MTIKWVAFGLTILMSILLLSKHNFVVGSFQVPQERDFAVIEVQSSSLMAQNSPVQPFLDKNGIKALIRERASFWGLDSRVMLRLAECESRFRQFEDDGTILRGVENPNDVGVFQIHTNPEVTDWLRISKERGWDIYTLEGNIEMAMFIASTERGYQHWVCF